MQQAAEKAGDQARVLKAASQAMGTPEQDQRYLDLASCPACGGASGSQSRSSVYALQCRSTLSKYRRGKGVRASCRTCRLRRPHRQTASILDSVEAGEPLPCAAPLLGVHDRGLGHVSYLPRDICDFDLLIKAIRPAENHDDVDVVIGDCGPIATPEMCNGLAIPLVLFDNLYSFALPDSPGTSRIRPRSQRGISPQRRGNCSTGSSRCPTTTAEHRALNYCVVRHPKMYENDNRLL